MAALQSEATHAMAMLHHRVQFLETFVNGATAMVKELDKGVGEGPLLPHPMLPPHIQGGFSPHSPQRGSPSVAMHRGWRKANMIFATGAALRQKTVSKSGRNVEHLTGAELTHPSGTRFFLSGFYWCKPRGGGSFSPSLSSAHYLALKRFS